MPSDKTTNPLYEVFSSPAPEAGSFSLCIAWGRAAGGAGGKGRSEAKGAAPVPAGLLAWQSLFLHACLPTLAARRPPSPPPAPAALPPCCHCRTCITSPVSPSTRTICVPKIATRLLSRVRNMLPASLCAQPPRAHYQAGPRMQTSRPGPYSRLATAHCFLSFTSPRLGLPNRGGAVQAPCWALRPACLCTTYRAYICCTIVAAHSRPEAAAPCNPYTASCGPAWRDGLQSQKAKAGGAAGPPAPHTLPPHPTPAHPTPPHPTPTPPHPTPPHPTPPHPTPTPPHPTPP